MKVQPIVIGVALLVAAAAGDRVVAERTRAEEGIVPTAPSGGVLSCPIATTGSGGAILYLANVGEQTARARVFIRTASNAIITERLGLAPGQVSTLPLHDLTRESSGLAIEWSGGRVIAAHSLHARRRSITPNRDLPRFMSAAQCFEVLGPQVALAAARTDLLGDTTLALFNPGPAPADVSIAIRVRGEYQEPQRLQRRIVRPLSRRDFSLRGVAFGAEEITAVVTMNSGRVVAEAYVENRGGAELLSAIPPLADGIALAGRSGPGVRMAITSTRRTLGPDPASGVPTEVSVQLDGARYANGTVEDPAELPDLLAPGMIGRIGVPGFNGRQPVGYELRPVAGTIAAAVSWPTEGERVFDLVTVPAAQPAGTWFAIVPGFGDKWRVELLVAAAGGLGATAELRVLGAQPRTDTLDLPPGTVRRVTIGTGYNAHAVVLTSEVPIAASFIGRSGGIAYGTLPSWLRVATATALDPQPVVGIGRGQP